ncbi:necrosis inducing-like protein NPP1 type [Phytophthora sojae]|uniref:Necrosis inducing-like protein NPP1 type n=1 Tax=Phytophthora sojae (strain P6497) TaxID=1094619 RepID=G4ZT33_PHYSP|nr:necrosis inducing-like protein NPP1 type [Phytophthora sojae]EGZ12850.1 necrosis inducing-like protein NPP1 type [Phytophthora sojae]|eukprot:XP_009530279.1 necrosis inducing-like protein NPP1 type [Phytophthora sojae]
MPRNKTLPKIKSKTASTHSINTPKPTVKYLDVSDALATKYPRATPNVTIKPTRRNPRETEPPTPAPTLPPTPAPTPAPTPPPAPWVTKTINHDEVKPFPQPEPVTISEKAAIKFKPQIRIGSGCVPYPVVSSIGETSAAFRLQEAPKEGAEALATARTSTGIDNPDVPEPKILGISASTHDGYKKYAPLHPENLDGNSVKVNYEMDWPINHALDTTDKAGTFQDLIMWEQMTEDARRALNAVSFSKANTPMNDGNFRPKLDRAWPF